MYRTEKDRPKAWVLFQKRQKDLAPKNQGTVTTLVLLQKQFDFITHFALCLLSGATWLPREIVQQLLYIFALLKMAVRNGECLAAQGFWRHF